MRIIGTPTNAMFKKLIQYLKDRCDRSIEARFKQSFSRYVHIYGWTICPDNTEKFVFVMTQHVSGAVNQTTLICNRHEVLEKIERWSREK